MPHLPGPVVAGQHAASGYAQPLLPNSWREINYLKLIATNPDQTVLKIILSLIHLDLVKLWIKISEL